MPAPEPAVPGTDGRHYDGGTFGGLCPEEQRPAPPPLEVTREGFPGEAVCRQVWRADHVIAWGQAGTCGEGARSWASGRCAVPAVRETRPLSASFS